MCTSIPSIQLHSTIYFMSVIMRLREIKYCTTNQVAGNRFYVGFNHIFLNASIIRVYT